MARAKPKYSSRKNANFQGRTIAYRNFSLNMWKTQRLLEVGLSGIADELEESNEMLGKLQRATVVPGPAPSDLESVAGMLSDAEKDEIVVFGNSNMRLLKMAVKFYKANSQTLRFHLYLILTVAAWGALETYIVMLFEELYKKKPEMLKSDEAVTFREIIEHQEAVMDYLVERQIEKIGHFNFVEVLKYLRAKINFEFSPARQQQLSGLYLIRNIVAHNSGVVQKSIHGRVPKSIVIKGNEIRITKSFLHEMLDIIYRSVSEIERHVINKFCRE